MSDKDENTVYLKCNVNEVFVSTEVCQYFSNTLSNPIELSISFPIKQEIQLNKFVVRIGNKVIVSKVLPKEKAKEKYDDSVSSGNLGFLGNYNDDGLNCINWKYFTSRKNNFRNIFSSIINIK